MPDHKIDSDVKKNSYRHFLDINDVSANDLRTILDNAKRIKSLTLKGTPYAPLAGKHLAMVFEKPSTRTRVSFEVGINQLGGQAIIMDSSNSQIGRGEPIPDTAGVLSRYVDIIMIRCFEHQTLLDMSKSATVPVVNGLTNFSHPCQIMADILTIEEHKGSIESQTVAWLGDGNNMVHSWVHAAITLGFTLNIATPKEFEPVKDVRELASSHANISFSHDISDAVEGADVVTTDCWVSMGDKDADVRKKLLKPFQVDANVMNRAKDGAIFMHCLPAHRGEEVTEDVIDGSQSVIFDEAENRLHAQKAIMLWCLDIT